MKKPPSVYHEVAGERARQDKKWGVQNHDPFKYLAILTEEVGEVGKALCDGVDFQGPVRFRHDQARAEYRAELIQVAAVAVAMIECLDRGAWEK